MTPREYQQEKAWQHAKQFGMTAEEFQKTLLPPTHLESIVIAFNIQHHRVQLSQIFASWGTPAEIAAGIPINAGPSIEALPQSPLALLEFFPCPPTVQNLSSWDDQQ